MSGPYASGSTQPLEVFCPHCGLASPPGMSFCNRCGKPLAGASASPGAPGAYAPQQPEQARPYYPPAPPQQPPYYPSQQSTQGGYVQPPLAAQAPYPNYQQPLVATANRPGKSLPLGFFLAFLLGPLGLLYSTVKGGITMILVTVAAWLLFFSLVVNRMDYYASLTTDTGVTWVTLLAFAIWIMVELISIIWAIAAVNSHNSKLQASVAL
ncbi:MAG TPA: zinc ribbon domain-containing protein [Chloroflexia bacterium]